MFVSRTIFNLGAFSTECGSVQKMLTLKSNGLDALHYFTLPQGGSKDLFLAHRGIYVIVKSTILSTTYIWSAVYNPCI